VIRGPAGRDTRRDPRVGLEVAVLVSDAAKKVRKPIRFSTTDVSCGGTFLRADVLFEVGEVLLIEFDLPGGRRIRAQGRVVRVLGKGRKERCTPLSKSTRAVLTAWTREPPKATGQPVFPNAQGGRLSAHGVQYLLAKHVATAATTCPSLKRKRVSPHVLRHTTAMDLLQEGVDRSVIALWLGHESIETTQMYLDADLDLKQRVLDRTTPPTGRPGRYRPDDKLLAFLKGL